MKKSNGTFGSTRAIQDVVSTGVAWSLVTHMDDDLVKADKALERVEHKITKTQGMYDRSVAGEIELIAREEASESKEARTLLTGAASDRARTFADKLSATFASSAERKLRVAGHIVTIAKIDLDEATGELEPAKKKARACLQAQGLVQRGQAKMLLTEILESLAPLFDLAGPRNGPPIIDAHDVCDCGLYDVVILPPTTGFATWFGEEMMYDASHDVAPVTRDKMEKIRELRESL